MKKEDKELLLKDLCARLPYGAICKTSVGDYKLLGIDDKCTHIDTPVYDEGDGYFDLEYEEVKPYLRPMSSMTEEEDKELREKNIFIAVSTSGKVETTIDGFDWLNKKKFDYHGLIPMGLALEATKDMYKEE